MKRVVGTVVGLTLVVLAALFPALVWGVTTGDDPAYEPTSITAYVADFEVGSDGSMAVTETITVDFPYDGRHGIFRLWDVADPNAPTLRREPHDVTVTMDGQLAQFEMLTEDHDRYHVAKIGDPVGTVLPGEHTYVIRYTVADVLVASDDHPSQLYWNLVPGGWAQSIARTQLTVRLPAAASDVRCAVGAGSLGGCEASGEGGTTLEVRTGPLDPLTPVTLQAGVDQPVPEVQGPHRPWPARYDPVLGPNLPVLALVVLAALGALAGGSVLGARSREPKPSYPLMYAPPEGIGPAQATYVLTESVGRESFVASVLHAAERGAVSLADEGRGWTITDKSGPTGWSGLDPVTAEVARLLHGPGTSFTADPKDARAGKELKARLDDFEAAVRTWAERSGLMVRSGLGSTGGLVVIASAITTLAVVVWNPLSMSALALVPGFFAVGAAPLLATGSGTRRTAAGRDLWSRIGGFHRVLSTPSSRQRFDFSGREELYTAYVPWAVALGCADVWAEKYRTETGHEPPVPSWFGPGYAGGTLGHGVDDMVDSFSDTLGSAISSYEATQKSSSGGGGGFSGGGGGGGGGGGSW